MASADVEYRCFVGGLAWATDSEALEKAFSQYGEVIDSKIINDRETGRSRGFGFVTFATEQSMRDAIEGMNGQDMGGRNITVNEAQSRGSGGGGGGRGGGGYSGGGGGGYGGRREGGYSRGGGGGGYGGGGGGYGGGGRDRSYGGNDGGYSRGGGGGSGNW
ncbi:Cinnamyl-alcohol dehydrogenase Flavonol reductase/cinnamoyl-CoA reductase [Trifolium repens]|nr:Cinnamyl-alcohol dehydrogenase Flavonol reductase/cinnamoyl-CoA reductase [Trifolium repens]